MNAERGPIPVRTRAAELNVPQRNDHSAQEIVERCLFPLIIESIRILKEGVAMRAADIDVVWTSGYGFPRHHGGPMFYADTIGLKYIRSAMVPLTMPLAMIAAIPVLLFTWSRQRAINFSTGLWADMTCALIGLKVQLTGEEHLQHPRPSVFILNHQSNADGFLVAKLIRRDIAYLGKAELKKHPVRSRLMQLGGLILVDRNDPAAASNSMQALINAIRKNGQSAAIFPEGRRSHSTTLGQFKKGAFLIALRAKVPIIPIVIHNSIDAQPRGESIFHPATVRVEVLPPIDTSAWKIKALDQRMAELVRQFEDVLGQ